MMATISQPATSRAPAATSDPAEGAPDGHSSRNSLPESFSTHVQPSKASKPMTIAGITNTRASRPYNSPSRRYAPRRRPNPARSPRTGVSVPPGIVATAPGGGGGGGLEPCPEDPGGPGGGGDDGGGGG